MHCKPLNLVLYSSTSAVDNGKDVKVNCAPFTGIRLKMRISKCSWLLARRVTIVRSLRHWTFPYHVSPRHGDLVSMFYHVPTSTVSPKATMHSLDSIPIPKYKYFCTKVLSLPASLTSVDSPSLAVPCTTSTCTRVLQVRSPVVISWSVLQVSNNRT